MKIMTPTTDMSVTGEYTQVDYDHFVSNRNGRLLIEDYMLKAGFEGREFFPVKTTKKAKITNFLNTVLTIIPSQLIIDDAFLEIFRSYSGQPYEVGKISVAHKFKILPYFLFGRTHKLPVDVINFEESTVSTYEFILSEGKGVYTPVECNSVEEFKAMNGAFVTHLSLDKSKIAGLHHFVCPVLNQLILSDEIASEIIRNKITGVELFELSQDVNIHEDIRRLERVY